jgi:hypothetical protein
MTKLKTAAAAFGLSAAVLAAAAVPASAAPVASSSVALKAAVADDLVSVAAKKKTKKLRHRDHYYYSDVAPWFGGPDTIGSLGYDGRYYAYNRFSGQRYSACMEDLGYGRVRPCDAGRR